MDTTTRSSSPNADLSGAARRCRSPAGAALRLVAGYGSNQLVIIGDLIAERCHGLTVVLHRLEDTDRVVTVRTGQVRRADSHGLHPILDSARRRHLTGRAPLRISTASPAVRAALHDLGLEWSPGGDLHRCQHGTCSCHVPLLRRGHRVRGQTDPVSSPITEPRRGSPTPPRG